MFNHIRNEIYKIKNERIKDYTILIKTKQKYYKNKYFVPNYKSPDFCKYYSDRNGPFEEYYIFINVSNGIDINYILSGIKYKNYSFILGLDRIILVLSNFILIIYKRNLSE